ncbi:MAG TPA: tRNA epoxyqueuosine(34) reductase QueG [Thermomicrobiales bacterium]|nr:tRNA epoxyqueuosine(34) reductase QueG [Thermomicrobiales bacterium]
MTRFDLARADLATMASASRLAIVGVTDGQPFPVVEEYLVDHVQRGHMAGMDWFTAERARQAADPATLHDDVRSIVSVAVPFWSGQSAPPDDGVLRGRIARYAWGRDYHTTLKKRMRELVASIEHYLGRTVESRVLVDTARIVDRAVAARAGTGWYGKNSMIIVPGYGSWVMLGEIMLDIQIQPDVPLAKDCGRCTICIDRCPTGAIVEPYRIDAPRCISYLTIEHRGVIPHHLRPLMGNLVFGCDICQDVCPYTNAARVVDDPDFSPRTVDNAFPSLEFLATMNVEQFRATYSGTPVTRAKRAGLARNAAIALGNSRDPRAEPILLDMLNNHDEPLARGHAAVALHQLTSEGAVRALKAAWPREQDDYVRDEIRRVLETDVPHAFVGSTPDTITTDC